MKEARRVFPTIVEQSAAGARFVVTLYGSDRCAIVPAEDLARLLELEARKPAKRRPK